MCGRFTLRTPAGALAEQFQLDAAPALEPRYNIAPTQEAPAIRASESGRRFAALLRWGLVPFWADDPSIGSRMINARGETVATKPAFRAAFQRRRCLIPADGYYEWRAEPDAKLKQPYLFHRAGDRPFVFAGLWESWQAPDGSTLETFAIVTTEASAELRPYHDRMPVVLDDDQWSIWLRPDVDREQLQALIATRPTPGWRIDPVSRLVNNPRHDRPECVQIL